MDRVTSRRQFVASAAGASTGIFGGPTVLKSAWDDDAPSNRVVVGVMGLARGRALALGFARQAGVVVKYLCDVDQQRAGATAEAIAKSAPQQPRVIGDFRRLLDDREVNVLICAAPNHWHAPATLLACAAGKHVYVEKPCSHNPGEGELMVEAARRHRRCVQMGTQRRSHPGTIEAIQKLRAGVIGRVYLARAWYAANRGSIGRGKPAKPPDHLDYELWQGPAPRRPYLDNLVHYQWHWRWHWGNGELGNNGVHTLDLCRWGLGVDYPCRVVSSGGRFCHDDDQETPDTHLVSFDFPNRSAATWQGTSCNGRDEGFVTFYGTTGSLVLRDGQSYTICDRGGKVVQTVKFTGLGEREHQANFLAAVRAGAPRQLNQEILEGHKSTLLCHLGNIAHRMGRVLHCEPKNGAIVQDAAAAAYWKREYAPGWEPIV